MVLDSDRGLVPGREGAAGLVCPMALHLPSFNVSVAILHSHLS